MANVKPPPTRADSRRMSIAVSPSRQSAPQPPRRAGGDRRHSNVSKGMAATVALAAVKHHAVLRRSLSGLRSCRDLRFEIFVSIVSKPPLPASSSPTSTQRHSLMVHRTMTLVCLQAMIQRELGVLFQDQHLFHFGDELEGDDELPAYGIQSQSELTLRVSKRHRRISDVFSRIKTIQFPSKSSLPEDYTVVEVVAPLPALPVVFRRIALAISYLVTLDRLQARRTQRLVWRADPFADMEDSAEDWRLEGDGTSRSPLPPPTAPSPGGQRSSLALAFGSRLPSSPVARSRRERAAPAQSFVNQQDTESQRLVVDCGSSRLARQLLVQQHLKAPASTRPVSAVRQIRLWLATLKYFVDAQVPDSVLHEVARTATYMALRPGDFIFRQGDPGDYFYILISGSVALAAYGVGYFATMTPGACFGEMSLLEPRSLRSASANVTFSTPLAELAVVPGDVYRRYVHAFKQAVLQANEHALFSIAQLRALPHSALTHLAYGIKLWPVRPGKQLIRRGEIVKVLVLLVKGAVKVSSAQQQPYPTALSSMSASASPPKLRKKRASLPDAHASPPYRIVSVVNGPAVFGQEGALSNNPEPAPWDVESIDMCSVVCIRPEVVSLFLSPCREVVRALLGEHRVRVEQFEQRFAAYHSASSSSHVRGSSRMLGRKKSSLHLMKPLPTPDVAANGPGAVARTAERVAFPKILLKDEDDISDPSASVRARGGRDTNSNNNNKASTARLHDWRRRQMAPVISSDSPCRPYTSPDSFLLSSRCAASQDEFLHRSLPFASILSLPEQIRFVSFDQQFAQTADAQTRIDALLDGLRRLPHEEVRLVSSAPVTGRSGSQDERDASDEHYYFATVPSR